MKKLIVVKIYSLGLQLFSILIGCYIKLNSALFSPDCLCICKAQQRYFASYWACFVFSGTKGIPQLQTNIAIAYCYLITAVQYQTS